MPPAAKSKKERGCFQCSRRRIVCDRTEPSCVKCTKKGIECSGLSRIRFAEGVARRGRLKDCRIPKIGGDDGCQELPTTTGFQALRWQEQERVKKRRKVDCEETSNGEDLLIPSSPRLQDCEELLLGLTPVMPGKVDEEEPDEVEEIGRGHGVLVTTQTRSFSITPWIAPIDPKLRMLFSYFSDIVASAMVILDDHTNGYRSLILPMALENSLLCRAVGVVAAQHLSRQRPELRDAAEAGRAAVISRLHSDSLQQSADKVFNKFTWATLIVLLVGETVTGSAEYRFLVQMLLSLSASNPGQDFDFELLTFLQAQTHMFELLGVPLLGEEVGVLTMMKASDSLMGFLTYSHVPEGCEDRRLADLIRQCFVSACNIYIRCAATADTQSNFHDAIQAQAIKHLIGTMLQIPPGTRGAHALVWVCFVAGAASTDQDQRDFFVHRMEQVYAQTHFRNIPTAIESLRTIWSQGCDKRWTVRVSQFSDVLVM
ncbi:hypothetical protein SVAN01_10354 [Stagonosporopsis vannaccii]|nr:hypothetical protein SVAN01_10354 [Stagonosporopsis vannaccii]